MKKLITSALPYVNNVPHLGNIIGCVLSADAFARFCRARGYETRYICGTDEYGTATENKAREEGLSPQEICDKYHAIHADIYRFFEISFDAFGRTSHPEQTTIAQQIFSDLDRNGLIREERQLRSYCQHDAMFLADRYVEGTCPRCGYEDARGDQCDRCKELLDPEQLLAPRCKVCGNPPLLRETTHLNLDLAALQPRLQEWFQASSRSGDWSRNAIQTTQAWLDRGLEPRPITRDLKWGIPVPKKGFEDKVFYVWFDAPIGYISITARAFADWREWWQNPDQVQLYQFMAKDNIPFHTVMFPASLLGTGGTWTLLHHIDSVEYLNYENSKFSKSRNVGVFGNDAIQTGLDADLWRFYLLGNRPERSDSHFDWNEFFTRINADLLDNLGNLIHRTLIFLKRQFAGCISDEWPDEHRQKADTWRQAMAEITQAMEAVQLRESLRRILVLGNEANKFFQDMAPWEAIKRDAGHAQATVSLLTYLVRDLAIVLEPFVPRTARRILTMLNLNPQPWSEAGSFSGLAGHHIGQPELLFAKLELAQAENFRVRFGGDWVSPDRLDLRVAEVREVLDHPQADSLYLLQLAVQNGEPRQVVAALKSHFSRADLLGRKVLLLANLVPADIRGCRSEGMVLCVEKGRKSDLFLLEDFPMLPESCGLQQMPPLTLEEFRKVRLQVSDHVLRSEEGPLLLAGRELRSALPHGKVR